VPVVLTGHIQPVRFGEARRIMVGNAQHGQPQLAVCESDSKQTWSYRTAGSGPG